MQGIERAYCDVCISALVGAWRELMESTGAETLRKVRYGKGDTLGLDAITEITIANRLKRFDEHAIFITEELDDQARRRWPTDSDPIKQPLMFFCDPTDRSAQLERFFQWLTHDDFVAKIGTLMAACDAKKIWEEMFEPPVSITGSTTAITCVRKGEVVFSIILNYISNMLCIATDIGVFSYQLKEFTDPVNEELTLADIARHGTPLAFPSARELKYTPDDCKRFVTFLGKSGYRENFNDSGLFAENPDKYLHHQEPPGPPRPLYLSALQNAYGPVGFILANGEKIGEWMHWPAFVKFAKNGDGEQALRAFEVSLERPWTKNGMLMSTAPAYSIFSQTEKRNCLDISQLRGFKRPSQFRCMLVVIRHDNERIVHVLQQQQYREVTGYF